MVGDALDRVLYNNSALEKRFLPAGMTAEAIFASTGLTDAVPLRAGQNPARSMSALQVMDWLDAFHMDQLSVTTSRAVSAARSMTMIRSNMTANDALLENNELFTASYAGMQAITELKTQVANYSSTIRNAVLDIEQCYDIIMTAPDGRERAIAYQKMNECYQRIREVEAIVAGNYETWQKMAGQADESLKKAVDDLENFGAGSDKNANGVVSVDSFAATLRSGLTSAKQSQILMQSVGMHSSDFTVLVAHKDELIVVVYDKETHMPLGSANVDIWRVNREEDREKPIDGSVLHELTTDTDMNRGAARFKSTAFDYKDEWGSDKFEVCYSVSKDGYMDQQVQHAVVAGGDIIKVELEKMPAVEKIPYVERVTISDQDCMTGSATLLCNRYDTSTVPCSLVLNVAGGYEGGVEIQVSYTARESKKNETRRYSFTAEQVRKETKDGEVLLNFSDKWYQILQWGTGDDFTVKLVMTPTSGAGYEIEVPVKVLLDLGKVSMPKNIRLGISSFFNKFLTINIATPNALHGSRIEIGIENPWQRFMFNAMVDPSGFAMLSVGQSLVDRYWDKETTDKNKQRFTSKDWDAIKTPIQSIVNGYNKQMCYKAGIPDPEDKDKIFGGNIRVTVGGSVMGAWKKQASSGWILDMNVQAVVSVQASAKWEWQFFAGPVPFVVRVCINAGVALSPAFQITALCQADPDDTLQVKRFEEAFSNVYSLKTGTTAFAFKLRFDFNICISLFGGLGVKGICSLGIEGGFTMTFSATILGGGDTGFVPPTVDSFTVGGYVKAVVKVFLVSFGYMIISGNFYPKDKSTQNVGDAEKAEDISLPGETMDSAVVVRADEINHVGKVSTSGADMKIVNVNGNSYGFYLKKTDSTASIEYLRLDDGINDFAEESIALPAPVYSAEDELTAEPDNLELYEFSVSSLDNQNLVMVTAMYHTKTVSKEVSYVTSIDGEDQKVTQEMKVPESESMYMRITFYKADANNQIKELTGTNHSTLIHLATAPGYYNNINSCMTAGTDDYLHAGIIYVAPGTREVSIYNLTFKNDGEKIRYKDGSKPKTEEPDFKGSPESMPYKDAWWVANEMDDQNWTDYGQVVGLQIGYTDNAHLSAYALLNMMKPDLDKTEFIGEVTALLGRTWESDWKGHTELLAVTTKQDPILKAGLKPTDAHIRMRYGIQGIELYSPGTGTDTVIVHYQLKDQNNSTTDEVKLDNGLLGIRMSSNGTFTYGGYKIYDVTNVPQNATFTTGLGFPALAYMETYDPPKKEDEPYYRLRVLAYDPAQNLMSKPYTAAILEAGKFPTDKAITGLHFYREKSGDGYRMKVIALQNEKTDKQTDRVSADIYNFPMKEVVSIDVQRFVLMTPAVRPGDTVSLYYTMFNDGNTPVRGFSLVVQDLGHQEEDGYKVFCTVEHNFADSQASTYTVYAQEGVPNMPSVLLSTSAYAASSEYMGTFDDRSGSYWFTEEVDAANKTTLRDVATSYLMPGETVSCEVKFTIPVTQVDDIDLRAVIAELYTDAVRLSMGEDAPEVLSAMAAWSAELRDADNGMAAYSRANNQLVPVSVRMTANEELPLKVLFAPYNSADRSRGTFAVGDVQDGTQVKVSYSAEMNTRNAANEAALFSRFADTNPISYMDEAADHVDLSLDATRYLASDGTEMVRIRVQNESLVDAKDIVINSYATDSDAPTYVMRLADSDFSMDHEWNLSIDVPLDILTAGKIADALKLRVSSPMKEYNTDNNEEILLLFEQLAMLKNPENVTIEAGANAGFEVRVRGGRGQLHYLWQICQPGKSSWTSINGVDSPELLLEAMNAASDGSLIRCVITDSAGQRVMSDTAVLRVTGIDIPKTGDQAQPELWLAMCVLAILGLVAALRRRRAM